MAKEEKVNSKPRPLSPHLQVYKPQLTSVLSILHRITGAANVVGLILFSAWVITLAHSQQAYEAFTEFMSGPMGQFLLIGWSFSVFYHMCNGIRHLVWDTGRLFTLKNAYRAGYVVVFSAFALTTLFWLFIYRQQIGL